MRLFIRGWELKKKGVDGCSMSCASSSSWYAAIFSKTFGDSFTS